MELSIYHLIITAFVTFLCGMAVGWVLAINDDSDDNDLQIL
jgi:hypothetical protein